MGCTQSKGSDPTRLPNEDLLVRNANAVMKQSTADKLAIRLLILGAGSSGKTTFRKQLRNIFIGYTEEQRIEYTSIVLENLWDGSKGLVKSFIKENYPELRLGNSKAVPASIPLAKEMEFILNRSEDKLELDDNAAQTLLKFWQAPEIQTFLQKRPPKLMVQECVFAYVKELEQYPKWGGPSWIPSAEDCIRSRVRTSGVTEETFTIDDQVFKIFDAGGQRSERRKWIHYFEEVSALIYVTSLIAYAENIFEDSTMNGLIESLDLFDSMVNSKHFHRTPIMLFFNKADLLEEYLTKLRIPLNRSGLFPDAPDTFDVKEAIDWQIAKFRARRRLEDTSGEGADANLFCHVMSAVSKENVDKVFATCRAIILKDSLKRSGFVTS